MYLIPLLLSLGTLPLSHLRDVAAVAACKSFRTLKNHRLISVSQIPFLNDNDKLTETKNASMKKEPVCRLPPCAVLNFNVSMTTTVTTITTTTTATTTTKIAKPGLEKQV